MMKRLPRTACPRVTLRDNVPGPASEPRDAVSEPIASAAGSKSLRPQARTADTVREPPTNRFLSERSNGNTGPTKSARALKERTPTPEPPRRRPLKERTANRATPADVPAHTHSATSAATEMTAAITATAAHRLGW